MAELEFVEREVVVDVASTVDYFQQVECFQADVIYANVVQIPPIQLVEVLGECEAELVRYIKVIKLLVSSYVAFFFSVWMTTLI